MWTPIWREVNPLLRRQEIEDIRRRAAARGHTLKLGVRLHVIVRETN